MNLEKCRIVNVQCTNGNIVVLVSAFFVLCVPHGYLKVKKVKKV